MSIIMTALAVAGVQGTPVPAAEAVNHAQHQQSAAKQGDQGCCCCKDMAGGKKMACCDKQEKPGGQAGHTGHSSE